MGRRRMGSLRGTGVALITPFQSNGSVDFNALELLVNNVIENGINYLVLLGTTAETATLNKAEKESVVDAIKQTNASRLPMVLGVGGNNTANVIEQLKTTNLSDFEAVLSVSPSYNKPTQEGIYQHFKAIAESVDQNIILYNVPLRTASNMNAETTLRLATDFENIVAIKEASPSFVQSTEIIKDKPDDFMVISGDDELALPMTLAGGDGVISVIGQALPESFSKMIQLGLDGKVKKSYQKHYSMLDLIRSIFIEGNPAGIKQLLSIKGICEPYTRLPLVSASKELEVKLRSQFNIFKN